MTTEKLIKSVHLTCSLWNRDTRTYEDGRSHLSVYLDVPADTEVIISYIKREPSDLRT